jgi:hypothetical protein
MPSSPKKSVSRGRGRPPAGAAPLTPEERAAARAETYRKTRLKRQTTQGIRHQGFDIQETILARLSTYAEHSSRSRKDILEAAVDEYLTAKGF